MAGLTNSINKFVKKSELLSENESPPKTARRGRARFTLSEQVPEEQKPGESPNRRFASRRRPETRTEAAPARKTYEVEEVIDDTPPIETFRKSTKHKVFTETKYEAQNAPPSLLFQPSTTENLEDIIKSIGSDILETTSSSHPSSPTTPTSLEPSPSELFSSEFTKIDNEITKTLETTTPFTSKATRRSNGRSRNHVATSPTPTVASRVRSRTRANRRPEETSSAPVNSPSSSRNGGRTIRRRPEANNAEPRTRRPQTISSAETVEIPTRSRTRAPPPIASAETVELPFRSRSGRKIPVLVGRRSEETKVPEKSTAEVPQARRTNGRKSVETTTVRNEIRSRSRSRVRDIPPVIDEQKLEVLPLFERESKTVKPVRRVVARRRSFNSAEEVETSATENDIKLAPKPPRQSVVVETRTEANIRRRKVVKAVTGKPTVKPTKPTTKTTTTSTTTTTTTTTAKPTSTKASTKPTAKSYKRSSVTTAKPTAKSSKPIIKQSVISEVSEVTSKRTVTRNKAPSKNKVEIPRFVSRGTKKSEVNVTSVKKNKSGLTSSEEEIDESDNYPEPFKALIQAKKQKKESRPQHRLSTAAPIVTKTTEKVVNSSPSTTTQIISSTEASRQLEDSENELDPLKSVRPTRRRFTQTSEKVTRATRKTKVARSTTVAPLPTREHRFHAKFNTEPEVTSSSTVKSAKGFSPKPSRGLYSSRKSKESFTKTKSAPTAQIPAPKKSNRYSSRYRNDASSRVGIRTSTNAPAYLPTIPTITPPTTSVKSPYQDKDLGVEVISFDDPVNTVPSANLVSGEYLASSTENHLTSPLVSASQTKTTEKPVSIIERIINSITAISTTEVPDPTRLTTPTQEIPTKESAILKLATKKSTKLDKTQSTETIPTVTVTTEKPTTIIERILSSLSAIQADNTTDTKNFKSKQVGTNFNTISSPSTTPISRVTKSTLPAHISTSVNPLYVLDEISNEQTLQKRTIDKLLALLNTLTTPSSHLPQLVVVTPKTTSYVVGTSIGTTTTTEPTSSTTTVVPSTTTAPSTTTTSTTTSQLFTSASPDVSLNARVNIPTNTTTTVRYTTTPTYTTLTTRIPTTPFVTTTQSTPTLTSTGAATTDISNEIGALPLSLDTGVTSTGTESTTDSSVNLSTDSSTPSTVDSSSPLSFTLPTTDFAVNTETAFAFPSTVPSLINFEVSPGSVSIFSANDLSNAITPDYFPGSTVTIPGRTNSPETVITTLSSTEMTTPAQTTTTTLVPNSSDNNSPTQSTVAVEGRFADIGTTDVPGTQSPIFTTTFSSTVPTVTTQFTTPGSVTLAPLTTTLSTTTVDSSSTAGATTLATNTPVASTTPASDTTTVSLNSSSSTTLASATTSAPSTPAGTTTLSPTTTDSANANNTQDISSNVIDTTGSPEKSNQTSTDSPPTNTTSRASGRAGRLLNILQDPVQNSIENSTAPNKDYFIFAVLNNNTVLRKRPSRFPTKDTPYLVVGVYPNNTIVRKFPNGTLVPMEPIIRVSGFDTRENPPPLPEITSNQVTPDQGGRPDNKNLQTVEQNTIPPLEANPLSLSSVNNATSTTGTTPSSTEPTVQANPLSISSTVSSTLSTSSSTSTTSSATSAAPGTTTTSTTAPTVTLPTLTEILNGRTVQAFNSIINISDLSKVQTLDVDPKTKAPVTTTMLPTPTFSNRILDDPVSSTTTMLPSTTKQPTTTTPPPTTTTTRRTTTAAPTTTTITTVPPTTTAPTTSTIPPTTTATFTTTRGTTVLPLSQPITTTYRTTTFFPTFLTTLFSTLRPRRLSTEAPITIVTPIPNRVQTTVTPRVEISTIGADLIGASSTRRTTRISTEPTTTMPSTLPVSTTRKSRRRGTTTTIPPTTTVFTTTTEPTSTITVARNARRSTQRPQTTTANAAKKYKQLTEQQKKDLEAIAQLEKEQAAILKQLAFLTNLNFANGNKPTTEKSDLANRIIALAVDRDKDRQRTTTPSIETLATEGSRQAKKIAPSDEQTIQQLVKQLNIATPSTITTEYGKSNDAIIAALLKEQGIGPTTPKELGDIYSLTTTTKRPRTTTRRPGPLMQSLNWLLNVLAPPTTKRPRPKPKSKPKPKPKPEEELLTQPTHITPVVTPAPRQNIVNALSQADVQKLIKQLESIQKDPQNSQGLDLSSIKSLQALLDAEDGVKVTSSGTTGTTRITTPATTTILTTTRKRNKNRVAKSTTAVPLSVSNSITDDDDDDADSTTTRSRVTLPPVRLRPVPGIEEDETLVRGQLISAAVNVTRAISSFLGTALQDAAHQFTRLFASGSANLRGAASSFQSLLGSGSRVVGSLMQVSSNTSSRQR